MISLVEATAPSRLELLGGPAGPGASGPLRLAIALDRRVWCRVERSLGGVEIHSKDTLQRVVAPDLAGIPEAPGPVGRAARVLAAARVLSGVRIVTQERVPGDAGLGTGAALSLALAAALEPGLDGIEVIRRAAVVEADLGGEAAESDLHAAAFGGAHVLLAAGDGATSVARLRVDPARIEECLLLVDPGQVEFLAPGLLGPPAAAADLVAALRAGHYAEVATFLAAVHRGRFLSAPGPVREVVDAVARAGGAAWPCGRLLAAWAAPGARSDGPREVLLAALEKAGVRSFPARIDVRGLEVE